MKLSHFCIMLLCSGVLTAVILSSLSQLIRVSTEFVGDISNISTTNSHSSVKLSDSADELFWFIQISDLHISSFHDEGRVKDLKQFCESTVGIIKPSVVLASGDLTDAKEKDNVGSRQIVEEWQAYSKVLNGCSSLSTVKWLDIRGNHDYFDVPGSESERNYHRKYSLTGKSHSFWHTVSSGSRKYTFLGLDACPSQGLRRPFNFVGVLRHSEAVLLRQAVADNPQTDYFIWFGHYPTSCILSQTEQVRSLIGQDKRSVIYLCGHLHSLGGLVPRMYTLQPQGFLELELADWKDNRMFRLVVIDHGLVSFVDAKFEDWPLILVTNPKPPIFASNREPVGNIATSSHIRVLVFSRAPVKEVKVSLEDGEWSVCSHANGPLWVLPWQPHIFTTGLHYIKVHAVDEEGRDKIVKQAFSLDPTQSHYGLLARFCLMTNISSISQVMFGLAVAACVLPLCLLRFMKRALLKHSLPGSKTALPEVESRLVRECIRKVWIVANIDKFFYPLIAYPLYLTIGPWFVGELMTDHLGIMFVWGTFVNATFLPGAFTYTFAFSQLFFFQWPFIIVLTYLLDNRLAGRRGVSIGHGLMCFVLLSQLYLLHYFSLAYGMTAALLGPYRSLPIFLVLHSWYHASYLPTATIRSAMYPWTKES